MRDENVDVARHRVGRDLVVLGFREVEQLAGAGEAFVQDADAVDDAIELGALLAELLRALGIVPDVRVFELAAYFLEPLALGIVVKDTP